MNWDVNVYIEVGLGESGGPFPPFLFRSGETDADQVVETIAGLDLSGYDNPDAFRMTLFAGVVTQAFLFEDDSMFTAEQVGESSLYIIQVLPEFLDEYEDMPDVSLDALAVYFNAGVDFPELGEQTGFLGWVE